MTRLPKVLVCGSRDWTDRETIRAWLARLPAGSTVVHGGARGADTIAGEEAEALGFTVIVVPAEWEKHGKAAGPLRNQRMLDEHPDLDAVLAFSWQTEGAHGIGITTGTQDMVARALRAGVRVTIIPPRRRAG